MGEAPCRQYDNSSFAWVGSSRVTSWWLTWEDLEWPDKSLELKWEKRAQCFARSGIDAVVIFGAHFRWDFVSIIDRVNLILGRIVEICHDHGLKIYDHHSALYVHRARNIEDRWRIRVRNRHHVPFYPDSWDGLVYNNTEMYRWLQISAKTQKPAYAENYRNQMFCPNHPEFQKGYHLLLERLLDKAPFDGLLSDDLNFMPDVYSCACRHCRDRFSEETGIEIPAAEDTAFWGNRENPDYQQWLDRRYVWTSDHYKRLRKFLPEAFAVSGSTASFLMPVCTEHGSAAHISSQHCDVICHEIYHQYKLDEETRKFVIGELAAYKALARYYDKQMIAIFYSSRPEDVPVWLNLLNAFHVTPWICKQVRTEDAITEEYLVADMADFKPETEPLRDGKAVIEFSESYRDTLPAVLGDKYYTACMELACTLFDRQFDVLINFDRVKAPTSDTQLFRLKLQDDDFIPVRADN